MDKPWPPIIRDITRTVAIGAILWGAKSIQQLEVTVAQHTVTIEHIQQQIRRRYETQQAVQLTDEETVLAHRITRAHQEPPTQ